MSDSSSGKHKRHRVSIRSFFGLGKEKKATPQSSGAAKERDDDHSHAGPLLVRKPGENIEETSKIEEIHDAPPSTAEYALDATKQTISLLKSIAELAPVPLVKDVLELGLKIIETIEAVNDVQHKVTVLKEHITSFLLVIAKVSKDSDVQSVNTISATKLSDELKADLQQLKGCLVRIAKQLDTIKDQHVALTSLLPKPNLEIIQECESHFQAEVNRFQTLQSLHAAQDLATIQQRLAKLYGITEEMALDVKDTQTRVIAMESRVNELADRLARKDDEGITILSRMPRVPGVFFGRDVVVQRIAEQLASGDPNRSRVCLVGPGGMGKTSAALAIMEHGLVTKGFAKQHRFWVPCIGANSPTLFLTTLFKQLRAERRTGDPLEDIVASLEETTDPRIILLDNFETPWHPVAGDQSDIQRILEELDALPHVSILVTMRSEFSPLERWSCEHLSQLKLEDAREIYTAIDKTACNHPELDKLLDSLGHLPYAITLMASRGKRSLSDPAQLLKEWKEAGTSMFSRTKEGINHSISLSIDSEFVRSSTGALRLLQILSMLPTGVYHEHLSTWAEGFQSEAIDTLRDAALVLARKVDIGGATKDHLFVLPVVQSYMKHNSRIPKEVEQQVYNSCYEFLAQNSVTIQGPNDPHFVQHALAIAAQEANIQALLTVMVKDALEDTGPPPYIHTSLMAPNATTQDQKLTALLSFSWYQCWTKPRPEITERVVVLARKSGLAQHEAAALFCLGSISKALSLVKNASKAFMQAQTLFEQTGDDLMALRSEAMAIVSQIQFISSPDADELVDGYQGCREERITPDLALEAWFAFHSGYFHWWKWGFPHAIVELEAAQELFDQLDPPRKFEMALSDFFIARAYANRGSEGDGAAALSAINSAISVFQSLYGQGLVCLELADSYTLKARILKRLDRWDEELDATLQVALLSFQELGISREIGQVLLEIAEVYVRKEDWAAAKLAYEETVRKCMGLEDHGSTQQVNEARHNLIYIAQTSAKDIPANSGEDGTKIKFWEPTRS